MEQHSYQNSASGSPSRRNRGSGDRGFWLAAVLCLFFFPPVGILMIVVKVLGGGRKKPNVRGQHPYYTQQHGSVGARTVQNGAAQNQTPSAPVSVQVLTRLSVQARRLTVVGGILSLIFGFTSVSALAGCSQMWPGIWRPRFPSYASSLAAWAVCGSACGSGTRSGAAGNIWLCWAPAL